MSDFDSPAPAPFAPEGARRGGNPIRKAVRFVVRAVLPLAIVAGSAVAAVTLMETAPKAERQPAPRLARLVEVEPVRVGTETVVVEAMGTVQAARKVTLQPRVSGQVAWVGAEFIPGGLVAKGEPVLKLDPTDYELVVKQREAAVAEAKSKLTIEKGQQGVARREFELLGRKISPEERDLVLRGPQLASVEAAIDTAEAALRQARLDLGRTVVVAPFDAIVGQRSVDVGMQVTPSSTLTTLVGTETYWIEASVPVDQLSWIDVPRDSAARGSVVRIFNDTAWGAGVSRTGRVVRLVSDLEEQGRMARLLIAIDDPLALKPANAGAPPLLIGSYVRAEIEGARLTGALIPRRFLRDGDTIWLMAADGSLEIRHVGILFRGPSRVVAADGIAAGDAIVTTDLASPVAGMPLRVRDAAAASGRRAGGGRPQ